MKQYLLSVYQPDGEAPPELLRKVRANLSSWNKELRAAGAWVFDLGLDPASASTVVRVRGDEVLITDGPFVEGKEHIGGFTIIRAPDLDAALEWGRKLSEATTLPIELRPVQGDDE